MSFVRSGPKILVIDSKNEDALKEYLNTHFKVDERSHQLSFEEIVVSVSNDNTVIYLADSAHDNVRNIQRSQSLIIRESSQDILMHLINSGHCDLLHYVRKGPKIVLMKVVDDIEQSITQLASDFNAVIEPTRSVLKEHHNGTVIFLTKENIYRPVKLSQLHDHAVFSDSDYGDVINLLDHHALKYLSENINNQKWCDLQIYINDTYQFHKVHYDRLIYILDQLGVGIVFKEGWQYYRHRLFFKRERYTLSLYTYLSPKEMKKILLALEFMENGERLVDFNLMYKKRELHWEEVNTIPFKRQEDLSLHYRHELNAMLSTEAVEKFRSMDEYIFATR